LSSRSARTVLDVVDGRLSELTWPELTLRHRRLGDRDVLVLTGAEPDFRWQEARRGRPRGVPRARAPAARRHAWGQPRRDPHGGAPHPSRPGAGDRIGRGPAAGGRAGRARGTAPRPVRRAVGDREVRRGRRHADRGLLRAGAALRGRSIRGGRDRDPGAPRAAPRRRSAARRAARRGDGAAAAARPDRPGRRRLANLRRTPRVGRGQPGAADRGRARGRDRTLPAATGRRRFERTDVVTTDGRRWTLPVASDPWRSGPISKATPTRARLLPPNGRASADCPNAASTTATRSTRSWTRP